MGILSFFGRILHRRHKEESCADPVDLIGIKKGERIPLYGGLWYLCAGEIVAGLIAEACLYVAWSAFEGSPRYSYAHDWQGKRRLWHFKFTSLGSKRPLMFMRQGRHRIPLKKLGWIVMAL